MIYLFLRTLILPFPKNINFTFIRGAHCFGLCFCSLFFYFLFKYIILSKVMDEHLYNSYIVFTFKGFWNVGRPPFFKFYEK